MTEDEARRRTYRIRIDRIAAALAAGGGACGIIATILAACGGTHGIGALALAFVLGTVFSILALVAIGGPAWLVLHALGWRGPAHAALPGALIGFLLFLFGQADLLPAADDAPLYGWLRAVGSSLVLAAIAASVALTMWRIAYRRSE